MDNRERVNSYNWLNKMILDKALSGYVDSTGPIIINWRDIDNFVFVLIQEYTGEWNYRLFVCSESFVYDRNKILYPSDITEDPRYVYDYYCNINDKNQELRKIVIDDWIDSLRVFLQD